MLSDDLDKFRAQLSGISAELAALARGQDDTTMAALIRNAAGGAWTVAVAVHDIKRHALRSEAAQQKSQ